jgi:phosphatidylinositol-3-phosphatase
VPTTGCPGLRRSGSYSPGRNPFVYFADVQTDVARCRSHIVPYTQLSTDLSAGVAPNFVFITPNLCNDMHDCSIATGDGWLKTEVPKILGSTAFTRQKSLLVVTWDEDDFTSKNKVATIFVSRTANHRSRLRLPTTTTPCSSRSSRASALEPLPPQPTMSQRLR